MIGGPRARRVAAALGALALSACSQSDGTPGDGGAAGVPPGATCQQIRLCILQAPCADEGCVEACAARGTPTARTSFEALRACTDAACPTVSDVNCACAAQCLGGGACLHEADDCLGAATVDDVCDGFCA